MLLLGANLFLPRLGMRAMKSREQVLACLRDVAGFSGLPSIAHLGNVRQATLERRLTKATNQLGLERIAFIYATWMLDHAFRMAAVPLDPPIGRCCHFLSCKGCDKKMVLAAWSQSASVMTDEMSRLMAPAQIRDIQRGTIAKVVRLFPGAEAAAAAACKSTNRPGAVDGEQNWDRGEVEPPVESFPGASRWGRLAVPPPPPPHRRGHGCAGEKLLKGSSPRDGYRAGRHPGPTLRRDDAVNLDYRSSRRSARGPEDAKPSHSSTVEATLGYEWGPGKMAWRQMAEMVEAGRAALRRADDFLDCLSEELERREGKRGRESSTSSSSGGGGDGPRVDVDPDPTAAKKRRWEDADGVEEKSGEQGPWALEGTDDEPDYVMVVPAGAEGGARCGTNEQEM